MWIFHLDDQGLLTNDFLVQPAFFVTLYAGNDNLDLQPRNSDDVKFPTNKSSSVPAESKKRSLLDSLICFLIKSDDLIIRYGIWKASFVWFVSSKLSFIIILDHVYVSFFYTSALYDQTCLYNVTSWILFIMQ